jgi:multicomponent Na+:H+ antiporter subunit D
MLAYSTLAQVGFILVTIGWNTPFALAAGMVFAFNHSLLKAGLLMLSGAVASRAPVKSASFEVLTGVGRGMPFAGVLFFIGLMALAGIPPLNGFISKLMFFRSGIDARAWISLIAIVPLSLFTLLYSWRAFVRVWWQPQGDEAVLKSYGDRLIAPLILIILCLVLGVWGEPLIVMAQAVAEFAFDPSGYVIAVLSAVGY